MTLVDVLNTVPIFDPVTIVDHVTGDIIVDCEPVRDVFESFYYHSFFSMRVYKLLVGTCHGDLLISI